MLRFGYSYARRLRAEMTRHGVEQDSGFSNIQGSIGMARATRE